MSDHGGCLVCGVTLSGPGRGEDLLCSDCQENGYMQNTGTTATLVRMTDDGPVRVESIGERSDT